MSRYPSLINALKAAEKVLTAETDDTAELANIASDASGIPADRILLGIDLTGIDLTTSDIDHLVDRSPKFFGAKLTAAQRRRFERAERSGAKRSMRAKIRTLRVAAISEFINEYVRLDDPLVAPQDSRVLDASTLRDILIDSVRAAYPADKPYDADYMVHVLTSLVPWVDLWHLPFFRALFGLFFDLRLPVSVKVVEVIDKIYFPVLSYHVGSIIAHMHPTHELDTYWVIGPKGHSVPEDTEIGGGDIHPLSPAGRAFQISRVRNIHTSAVEVAMDLSASYSDAIKLLAHAKYDCDNNAAERIAARLTNSKWPPHETRPLLNARVHQRIRGALFRQLLQQGNEARVIEVLRWLNDDRGAVGALSLDDAFQHIKSFGVGLRFAFETASSFSDSQIAVVYFALRNIASSQAERDQLEKFRRTFNYSPPRRVPGHVMRVFERNRNPDDAHQLDRVEFFNVPSDDDEGKSR